MFKQAVIAALYGVIFLGLLLVDFALGNGFVAMTHRVFCKIFCFVKILNKYKQYHYRDRIDELLNESKEALRQTNEFLEKWRVRRLQNEYYSEALVPIAASSSNSNCKLEKRLLTLDVTDDGKWRSIVELYNSFGEHKDIQLPEFNPAKIVDVHAWITTSDMRIGNVYLQGGPLLMLLRRALKGDAFRWLLKLPCHDITWIDFKNLLITRYAKTENAAMYLFNLHNSEPRASECLEYYADNLMAFTMKNWENLTFENIAVATVLAHVSRFDSRIEDLLTKNITTIECLQQAIHASLFRVKQKMTDASDQTLEQKSQFTLVEASSSSTKTSQFPLVLYTKKDVEVETLTSETSSKSLQQTWSTSCFNCGALGHLARFCPLRVSESVNPDHTSNDYRVMAEAMGLPHITWQGSFSENSYLDEEPQAIKPLNLELPILHMAIVDTLGTSRSQPERGDAGDHMSVSDSTLLSVTSFLDNDFRQVSTESIDDEPANEPCVFEDTKVEFPSRLLWDVVEEDSNQSD